MLGGLLFKLEGAVRSRRTRKENSKEEKEEEDMKKEGGGGGGAAAVVQWSAHFRLRLLRYMERVRDDDFEDELMQIQRSHLGFDDEASCSDDTYEENVQHQAGSEPRHACCVCLVKQCTVRALPCNHKVMCRRCAASCIKMQMDNGCDVFPCVLCRTHATRFEHDASASRRALSLLLREERERQRLAQKHRPPSPPRRMPKLTAPRPVRRPPGPTATHAASPRSTGCSPAKFSAYEERPAPFNISL